MWPIDLRRIPPSQAIANDVNDPADHATVVDTRSATRFREVGFDAFELGFAEPVLIRHGRVLLPNRYADKADILRASLLCRPVREASRMGKRRMAGGNRVDF